MRIPLLIFTCLIGTIISAQTVVSSGLPTVINIPPMPTMKQVSKDWGPNDTIMVPAIWYGEDYDSFKMMPYKVEDNIWISKLSPEKLAKVIKEWTRLRNAVYVCYPYARTAGYTINEINKQVEKVNSTAAKKAIIKSREKDLRKQFAEPLSQLSVYQGKVLMKLVNRQTGNNCYDIVKEFKGGLNARLYQTVLFFYGTSLKQKYDTNEQFDRDIENIVQEIDGAWYQNPYRVISQ